MANAFAYLLHFLIAFASLSMARFSGHENPQTSLADQIGASESDGAFPPLKTFTSSPKQIMSCITAVVVWPVVVALATAPRSSLNSVATMTMSASAGSETKCNFCLASFAQIGRAHV